MRVLFYTRHNATEWFRSVASKLTVASETLIMSELRREGDVSLAGDFYRFYRDPGVSERARRRYGDEGCAEMIARCRLLRNLQPALAMRMIGAASEACAALVDRFKPDAFVAFRIDSYVLDVMDRVLQERGIPYVGLWRAALIPDMIFFTTRGEYIPVREPGEEEIAAAVARITAPEFKATSLKRSARYDFTTFLTNYAYNVARDLFLHGQRFLDRDPLGSRYLTTRIVVPEYRHGLGAWGLMKYMREDWKAVFDETPPERRIFIGLQVNPEATIDYYVRNLELARYQETLFAILDSLERGGYRVFLKDHPNMFGRRSIEFIRAIAARPSVVLVPYDVSSNGLVAESHATFTWTGTVGLQASMAGKCPVVVDPTYLIPGAFIQIRSLADIAALPERVREFRPPADLEALRRQTARHVLRAFVPGSMRWQEFRKDPARETPGVERLCATLDTYLPTFARPGDSAADARYAVS